LLLPAALGGAFCIHFYWEVNELPNERTIQAKKEIVDQLKAKLDSAVTCVVVDYKGISVEDDTKLRKQLREAGVDYFVAKNTMLRLAAKEAGYEGLNEYFEGTTAVAISDTDPVSAAKILNDYAEDAKANFSLKAGMVEGKIFDKAGIEAIAKLPSKDQLLAQLCSVLNGNIRGLAVALNAIAEKGEQEIA
jgi:ribosomal protein L10